MKPILTIDEKRAIVIDHYSSAYQIQVNPSLPDEVVEEYFQKIHKLARSEQSHKERKNAQTVLRIVQ